MGLTLTPNPDKQSKFIEVPVGTHLARCYQVIDCGMQLDPYTVGETKYKHKVALLFEVHGRDYAGNPLTVKNGEPMSIDKMYTASIYEKAPFFIDLQNWRGRPFTAAEKNKFEIKNVLGAWGMISVKTVLKKNGEPKNVMSDISGLPPELKSKLPVGFNELKYYDLDDPNQEVFDSLSPYWRKIIQSSQEYQGLTGEAPSKPKDFEAEDDIPFN